jgi:hypothetical protein
VRIGPAAASALEIMTMTTAKTTWWCGDFGIVRILSPSGRLRPRG